MYNSIKYQVNNRFCGSDDDDDMDDMRVHFGWWVRGGEVAAGIILLYTLIIVRLRLRMKRRLVMVRRRVGG